MSSIGSSLPRLHRLLAIAQLGLAGCTLRQTYINLSYAKEPRAPLVERQVERVAGVHLLPLFLLDYHEPPRVAACLEALVQEPLLPVLWEYGRCLERSGDRGGCRIEQAEALKTRLSPAGDPACTSLSGGDAPRLAYALLSSGEALVSLERSLYGLIPPQQKDEPAEDLVAGWKDAVQAAAVLLNNEPPPPPDAPPRADLPALALSGGAANGAFTAGYLHAMLVLREEALAAAEDRSLDYTTRLGGAVTTSVGTLAGLALDLYFVEPDATLDPKARSALQACLGQDALPGRAPQACALKLLEQDFRVRETELFCSERGWLPEAVGFWGKKQNLLRFDPLMEHRVRPFFDNYGPLVLDNGFIRAAMAVEVGQNLVIPLDERACRALPAGQRTDCLAAAVEASIAEPAFVPPVGAVHAGLGGNRPLEGSWYDGGLRSGTPATSALARSRGPVLAVNTHRAAGVPAGTFETAGDLLLRTIDSLVHQGRDWEMAYAARDEAVRGYGLLALERWLEDGGPAGLAAGALAGIGQSAAPGTMDALLSQSAPELAIRAPVEGEPAAPPIPTRLLRIFVPDDPTGRFPLDAAAAGYAFDPAVTHALFLWGTLAALEQWPVVSSELGWQAAFASSPRKDAVQEALESKRAAMRRTADEDLDRLLKKEFPAPDASEDARLDWLEANALEQRRFLRRNLPRCESPDRPPAR